MYKVTFEVEDPNYTKQTAPTGDMLRGEILELLQAEFPEAEDTLTVVQVVVPKE